MSHERIQEIARIDDGFGARDEASRVDARPSPARHVDIERLVQGIRAGNAAFVRELDSLVSPGVLFQLAGSLPPADLADQVHGIVVAVVRRIRDGELENPGDLLEFVRCVTKEHIAVSRFAGGGDSSGRLAPSPSVFPATRPTGSGRDSTVLMRHALRELSARDREALERYYVLGQSEEVILKQLRITPAQFRQLKAGVKLRFLASRVYKNVP